MRTPLHSPPSGSSPAVGGKKVFVIDDEITNYEVIARMLRRDHYQLTYATNGREALEVVGGVNPDVILLDVMMPYVDGLGVCRQLKADARYRHIPIIIVTALSSKSELAQCLDAGADDFISKPVSRIELRSRVRSMLRIKQQFDQLQAVQQLRDDMTRMLVHDIRSPLTNILLSCESLRLTPMTPDQLRKVDRTALAAKRMEGMVDELLTMSRAESGRLQLNCNLVAIDALVHHVCDHVADFAARKKVVITCHSQPEKLHHSVDAALFQRVIENLLINAIKYSPEAGKVWVWVEAAQPQIRVRVVDQGKGVPPELHQSIFEKYTTGTVTPGFSQFGLGLAFCKMVIEAHGGRIFVEDAPEGGACFVVLV
ncbi:MAG: response regulator [Oscillatoriales cyanobacterium SM2_2_1]|nr:response regulator [Oscillatoriales cyanobacterium SM2_2_1]